MHQNILRKFFFLSLLFLCSHLFAQNDLLLKNFHVSSDEFDFYQKLNNLENRLIEFKDVDSILIAKIAQLHIINKSREDFKVSELTLDILASRVANKMAQEAAKNNFLSHWNLNNEKPYHRYGLAGGVDHIVENAHSYWEKGNLPFNTKFLQERMIFGHNQFMAEKRPADGHKQTIITASHTSVGIGVSVEGNQFRYYEEFIGCYLDQISVKTNSDNQYTISFTPKTGQYVHLAIISYDKLGKRTPKQLNQLGDYLDQGNQVIANYWSKTMNQDDNGVYHLKFTPKKKGLYYVQVFLDNKPPKGNNSISTKGTHQGMGVVIKY